MSMISDHDMGITCDGPGEGRHCTRQAHYACTITRDEIHELRPATLLCPQCCAELLQRAAALLNELNEGRNDDKAVKLHDVIQVDHLISGATV
jgi:hypothetical protein